MLIVAERINSSRKAINAAIVYRDEKLITAEVKVQADAGADYIDVNAGAMEQEEAGHLEWLIEVCQKATNKPLCLDSADPGVLAAVIEKVDKPPLINSASLEERRLDPVIDIAISAQAGLIALCQSDTAQATSVEDKVVMAGRLVERAGKRGLPPERLYIDPLVFPLATDATSARATLEGITKIMKSYSGVHTICGLTNISFGLPNRKLLNRAFLACCISRGMDAAILDPTDRDLFAVLAAARAINGQDEYCLGYIQAYREKRLS
jgi:5-methyltetrahydrofolate corrinoid/iron sulfur protein methyltransferase